VAYSLLFFTSKVGETLRIFGGFTYLYTMAKEKKQRADKYEEKLAINGTFDDLIKVSVNYTSPKKAIVKKSLKKKNDVSGDYKR
jgi:hypothetical protein